MANNLTNHPEMITIGETRVNRAGGRSAPVSQKDGKSVQIVASQALLCPFGASAFQDPEATRCNMDFSAPDGVLTIFQGLDEHLIAQAIKSRETLFTKSYTPEQIRSNYTSPIKERSEYPTTVRAKVDLDRVRCWDLAGKKAKMPEDRCKGLKVWPKIHLKGIWIMGSGSWGPSYEVTDLRMEPAEEEACPWAAASSETISDS